jgi:uncharacterized protein
MFVPFIPILKILPLDSGKTELESITNLVFVFFLNISFVLAAWIMLKWVDHRSPAMLGLNFWTSSLREILIGFGLGFVNLGLVFFALLAFGWISVEWAGITLTDTNMFIFYLGIYFVFASIEELINRGYLFQVLSEGVGVFAAAVIINSIFSLGHILNPDFSILAAIFLFIHGLLYTVAYLKTRSLWTPIGLHMAWNFTQGPVAGMKVSGTSPGNSFLLTDVSGPDLLTGGNFGVEGGLVAIFISAIILFVLLKADWLKPSRKFLRIQRTSARENRNHEK